MAALRLSSQQIMPELKEEARRVVEEALANGQTTSGERLYTLKSSRFTDNRREWILCILAPGKLNPIGIVKFSKSKYPVRPHIDNMCKWCTVVTNEGQVIIEPKVVFNVDKVADILSVNHFGDDEIVLGPKLVARLETRALFHWEMISRLAPNGYGNMWGTKEEVDQLLRELGARAS